VVHVVDVGTGLAVLIQGEDFSLVYDGGSNDDTAIGDKNRFVAYLRAALPDLGPIQHVVLSHPHRDHVELLADVIASYRVGDVWDAGVINPICGYRRFVDAIAQAPNVRYHTAANGAGSHEIDFQKVLCTRPELPQKVTVNHSSTLAEDRPVPLGSKATMTFLHVDGSRHGDDFNESSLVVAVELDGTKVLLMGDAEAGGREKPSKAPAQKSVEGYVLARYRKQIDADVLIVGHHGSMSSSREAFLAAVTPRVSVISAGPTKYHSVTLPDPEIVEELERAGKLLRTDVDDAACAKQEQKIGPDADDNPGGCHNVQIRIQAGRVTSGYATLKD